VVDIISALLWNGYPKEPIQSRGADPASCRSVVWSVAEEWSVGVVTGHFSQAVRLFLWSHRQTFWAKVRSSMAWSTAKNGGGSRESWNRPVAWL